MLAYFGMIIHPFIVWVTLEGLMYRVNCAVDIFLLHTGYFERHFERIALCLDLKREKVFMNLNCDSKKVMGMRKRPQSR